MTRQPHSGEPPERRSAGSRAGAGTAGGARLACGDSPRAELAEELGRRGRADVRRGPGADRRDALAAGERGRERIAAGARRGRGWSAALLLIHDLHPVPLRMRVLGALEHVRPYMESHGGDVELLSLEEGVARIRLQRQLLATARPRR